MKYIPKTLRDVITGCWHLPFQEKKVFNAFMDFLKWWKPHRLFMNGDIFDLLSLSKFVEKNTNAMKYADITLNEELVMGREDLVSVRNILKNCEFIFKPANHEARINNLKNGKDKISRNLRSIPGLDLPSLLRLDDKDLKIKYVDNGFPYEMKDRNGYIVLHGDKTSKNAAEIFSKEYRCNGINGHSHRLEEYSFVDRMHGNHKPNLWYQNGCLCSEDAKWSEYGKYNWHYGFLTGEYIEDKQDYRISVHRWQDGNFYIKNRLF